MYRDTYLEERQKARERIGETSEKALQWLLRFAKTDLSQLTEGQWLDLEKEMDVFIMEPPPGLSVRWDPGTKPRPGLKLKPSLHPTPGFRPKIFWRSRVTSFQGPLRKWLDDFMKPGGIWFEPMRLQVLLRHPKYFFSGLTDAQLPENFGFSALFENYEQTFAYNVAHLLGAHSGRLRLCGECKHIFLADRRQQVFCSARCLNRVTQRRWREAQKEKQERRRHRSKSSRKRSRGGATNGKKRR